MCEGQVCSIYHLCPAHFPSALLCPAHVPSAPPTSPPLSSCFHRDVHRCMMGNMTFRIKVLNVSQQSFVDHDARSDRGSTFLHPSGAVVLTERAPPAPTQQMSVNTASWQPVQVADEPARCQTPAVEHRWSRGP